MSSLTSGGMTEYVYDAEGQRVMKGTISTFTCNPASDGFSVTTLYTRGLNGEDLTELTESSGSYQWDHTNVFADGQLLATYKGTETYFVVNDWLGTKRAEATTDGSLATYSSLPWGNGLTVSGTIPDPTDGPLANSPNPPIAACNRCQDARRAAETPAIKLLRDTTTYP